MSGRWAAKNILAEIEGKPRTAFRYLDKGIMAMIGRNAAIAEVGTRRHELTGPMAYAMWLGVHLASLGDLQVKVETFVEWIWNYFQERDPRLLDRSKRSAHRLVRREGQEQLSHCKIEGVFSVCFHNRQV